MSRSSRRDNSTATSLFPFLAVLLSTMGVLVVLLVMMASVQTNQAKSKHEQVEQQRRADLRTPETAAEQQSLRQRLEEIRTTEQEVQQARREAHQAVQDTQHWLSQIEENVRRQQDRLEQVRREIFEFHQLQGDAVDDTQQAAAELERRRQRIADLEAEIKELEKQRADEPDRYAIVPYSGTQGTRRRPIYIECRRDRVIIQPEGIELLPQDFNEHLGAGAPLPAAIRAAMRYYVDQAEDKREQPYPLLIVRPDAVGSFRRALNAIESSTAEFGYEIVEHDWKLDYSATNPALARELERAVANARRRMDMLRHQAPEKFAESGSESFEPGMGLADALRRGALPPNYRMVGGRANRENGNGTAAWGATTVDVQRLAAALESARQPRGAVDNDGSDQHGEGPSDRQTAGTARPTNTRYASITSGGDGSSPGPKGGGTDSEQAQDQAAHAANDSSQRTDDGSSQHMSNDAVASDAQSPGAPPAQGLTSTEQAAGESSPMEAFRGNAEGSASQSFSAKMTDQSPANRRRDRPSQSGMALVRAVHVQVHPSQLVVQSSGGRAGGNGATISFDNDIQQAADEFLKAIEQQVQGWGIAGEGLYWRPVLQLKVAPGGEDVAKRLAEVLESTGLEVQITPMRR